MLNVLHNETAMFENGPAGSLRPIEQSEATFYSAHQLFFRFQVTVEGELNRKSETITNEQTSKQVLGQTFQFLENISETI